jgi:predicted DNA-binding transcriptional regulator YafY
MNVTICDAIRARRLLRFVYDGYERVVEPHAYGVNTAGHEALSGWLVGGWSASATEPGWRMFRLDQMRDVAALAEAFDAERAGYNHDDPHFVRIYCQLDSGGSR